MDHEVWKTISDFPRYAISNYGRVKNIITNQVLNPLGNSKQRYLRVQLYRDGGNEYKTIHQLVAKYFVTNKYSEELKYINHLDRNKHNNRADNLEWCTPKYNVNYSKEDQVRGSRRSAVKRGFTRKIVAYNIYTGVAVKYNSTREAERFLGVSSGNMATVLQERAGKVMLGKKYTFFYTEQWNLDNLVKRVKTIVQQHQTAKSFTATNISTGEMFNFSSMRKAECELGFPHQAISRCLYGKQESTHGYTFKFDNNIVVPTRLPKLIINKGDY